MDFLSKFVDADKLGGWTRAGVASALGLVLAKAPGLSDVLTSDTQNALGVAAAALVVGLWSHYAKSAAAGSTAK